MGLCLPGPLVPPSMTATQLRNLVKITMLLKASSYEPQWRFKAELLSPRSGPASVFSYHCVIMLSVSQGCKLFDFRSHSAVRHNGTETQRSQCMLYVITYAFRAVMNLIFRKILELWWLAEHNVQVDLMWFRRWLWWLLFEGSYFRKQGRCNFGQFYAVLSEDFLPSVWTFFY